MKKNEIWTVVDEFGERVYAFIRAEELRKQQESLVYRFKSMLQPANPYPHNHLLVYNLEGTTNPKTSNSIILRLHFPNGGGVNALNVESTQITGKFNFLTSTQRGQATIAFETADEFRMLLNNWFQAVGREYSHLVAFPKIKGQATVPNILDNMN